MGRHYLPHQVALRRRGGSACKHTWQAPSGPRGGRKRLFGARSGSGQMQDFTEGTSGHHEQLQRGRYHVWELSAWRHTAAAENAGCSPGRGSRIGAFTVPAKRRLRPERHSTRHLASTSPVSLRPAARPSLKDGEAPFTGSLSPDLFSAPSSQLSNHYKVRKKSAVILKLRPSVTEDSSSRIKCNAFYNLTRELKPISILHKRMGLFPP